MDVALLIGSVANEHQALSQRILTEYGFDYQVEFVCGPRASRALHIVIYNRTNAEERTRMQACYRALLAAYDEAGYPAGRMPTDFQEEVMERLPSTAKMCHVIKSALDPNGIIAPGKYGIN